MASLVVKMDCDGREADWVIVNERLCRSIDSKRVDGEGRRIAHAAGLLQCKQQNIKYHKSS